MVDGLPQQTHGDSNACIRCTLDRLSISVPRRQKARYYRGSEDSGPNLGEACGAASHWLTGPMLHGSLQIKNPTPNKGKLQHIPRNHASAVRIIELSHPLTSTCPAESRSNSKQRKAPSKPTNEEEEDP